MRLNLSRSTLAYPRSAAETFSLQFSEGFSSLILLGEEGNEDACFHSLCVPVLTP
ncbi:MAG: hypothetical protein V2A66_04485 [Pseudomonadota bacterium]